MANIFTSNDGTLETDLTGHIFMQPMPKRDKILYKTLKKRIFNSQCFDNKIPVQFNAERHLSGYETVSINHKRNCSYLKSP